MYSEEEEGERKKDEKEGIQLVSAVIDFVKELDPEIKTDISSNVSAIIKQVPYFYLKILFLFIV